MEKDSKDRRISILIPQADYEELLKHREGNLSNIIRNLIQDYLSPHKITLKVSENTRRLYDVLVSNNPNCDEAVEKYLRNGMSKLVDEEINKLQKLKNTL